MCKTSEDEFARTTFEKSKKENMKDEALKRRLRAQSGLNINLP